MPRKRMIDPAFWRDEKVGLLTFAERLLFIGLWNYADDEGYGRANPALLKADIFPYDEGLTTEDLAAFIQKLEELGFITLYSVNQQSYYHVKNFLKYQTISKPTKSTLPKPNLSLPEHLRSTPGVLPEYSWNTPSQVEVEEEENIKEINLTEEEKGFSQNKEGETKENPPPPFDRENMVRKFGSDLTELYLYKAEERGYRGDTALKKAYEWLIKDSAKPTRSPPKRAKKQIKETEISTYDIKDFINWSIKEQNQP